MAQEPYAIPERVDRLLMSRELWRVLFPGAVSEVETPTRAA